MSPVVNACIQDSQTEAAAQSGSTGKPKGVVISQASIIAGAASAEYILGLTPEDKYLAYLPLAHIMELMVEFVVVANGSSLNYADPKSLTATGSYPVGALEVYGPTHMVAVPKIWDTIKKGLLAKVALSSPVAQVLVHTALAWRAFAVKYGLDTPLFNALVFKKFKKAVGGNLKWALSGGGPLNGEVQEFIRVAFNLPLIQGYGLTETCAGLSIQAEDDDRPGIAGVIIPSCEVKMISTPDVCDKGGIPYLSTVSMDHVIPIYHIHINIAFSTPHSPHRTARMLKETTCVDEAKLPFGEAMSHLGTT
jgi:long-chain acyl-CoA synthetase